MISIVTFTNTPETSELSFRTKPIVLDDDDLYLFQKDLLSRLDELLPIMDTPLGRGNLNAVIAQYFREIEHDGGVPMIFDGLRIVGGEVIAVNIVRQASIAMIYEFWPSPRFGKPQAKIYYPMGFFEEFDLWFVRQATLPSTMIARYGNEAYQYLSANPFLLDQQQLVDVGAWAVEAKRRAKILGLVIENHYLNGERI